MLEYSAVGISAAIVDITIIQCALYCKLGAKYSAHPPVYAMCTVVPAIYKVFTAPHIQTSIYIWTHLRCYRRYLDNAVLVILQTWCQIQRTSSSLRYVICGSGHIQCIYSSAFSDFNIHMNVSALIMEICRQFNARYTATLCQIQRTSSSFRYVNRVPGHIQCIYSSAYSGINTQL
jgi:hypothetical protein